MIIELESPFKEIWRKGYLRESVTDGRKRVDLFNSNSDRTTISYARYLMSVRLGYIVPDEFEVDHKDDNKANDIIGNLQLLTDVENKKKQEQLAKSQRIPKHGTLTEYRYCKCDLCKEAKSVWMKQYNKDRDKLQVSGSNPD